jgi:hypothetical protein
MELAVFAFVGFGWLLAGRLARLGRGRLGVCGRGGVRQVALNLVLALILYTAEQFHSFTVLLQGTGQAVPVILSLHLVLFLLLASLPIGYVGGRVILASC